MAGGCSAYARIDADEYADQVWGKGVGEVVG